MNDLQNLHRITRNPRAMAHVRSSLHFLWCAAGAKDRPSANRTDGGYSQAQAGAGRLDGAGTQRKGNQGASQGANCPRSRIIERTAQEWSLK